MENCAKPVNILLADDDEEDCMLTERAFKKVKLINPLFIVNDGVELLQFLRHDAPYQDPQAYPRPGIILLDLNMPKLSGREALQQIRADEALKDIPIIVLTTSNTQEDINEAYQLGANSYITKPVTYAGMVEAMAVLKQYWFSIVELP